MKGNIQLTSIPIHKQPPKLKNNGFKAEKIKQLNIAIIAYARLFVDTKLLRPKPVS